MKRTILLALTFWIAAAAAFADGFIIIEPPGGIVAMPRPWPAPRPYAFAPLEVVYHHVDVKIDDSVARTSVDQEFYNPNPARLEGTYVFPLPKGAQIDKFSMFIDGKEVEAELLPADKARSIYEDIVRKMRDPALLEYADRGMLKARVFPIEPNSRKRLKISYTQLLKTENGLSEYHYLLSTEKYSAKPIEDVSVTVNLNCRAPIKTIYSPSHNVEIKHEGDHRASATYRETRVTPDTDFQLFFSRREEEVGLSLLTFRPRADEDGYFLLLAAPSFDAKKAEIMEKDVAFVVDTSGSMAGPKMEQLRKALRFCVDNLNAGDRFEIVRFSTEAEPLFGNLRKADKENKDRAQRFVEELRAAGGTAIDDALQTALKLRPEKSARPFVVIFLTDGLPTIGETDVDKIRAHAEKATGGNVRVFCFGIGTDVNTHLLDRLAEATRGTSDYVLPREDIEIKISNFFAKVRDPVLTEAALKFGDTVHATKLYPTALPDLFRGEQLVLLGRYSGDGAVAITLTGMTNGKPQKFVFEGTLARQTEENPFIARLWASRRIGYLLDEIRLHGESQELKDEVGSLARTYGIVTPYTSFLILEDQRHLLAAAPASAPRPLIFREELRERDVAEKAFRGGQAPSGAGAVADSLQRKDSKEAYNLPQAAAKNAYAASETGFDKLQMAQQQVRNIHAKTFYQQGNRWIDADAQQVKNAKAQQITFGSTEYFALLQKHQNANLYLANGQNVTVVLDGALYEITE